ncbi:MAG: glycosyltransferase family 2 protein [Acidobacteria bacterium]|nr:glycosyltransferase family 2 protein [Acidobacteriota bacterium]
MKITAVIIAFNEEEKIGRALRSVDWADEILVIDSHSSDRTAAVATEFGARVIERDWPGFARQKQFGVDSAANDWIFSLDADEEVSSELRTEIERLRSTNGTDLAAGYRIPRLTFYMDRPIRHGGWYPDWQTRLFDRRRGHWIDTLVHESVKIDGRIEKLGSDILHFSIDSVADHHRLIGERYAPLAAEQMFTDGRRTGILRVLTAGPIAFLQTYFLKLGILDGLPGFCIAKFAAHHAFLKHLLLFERRRREP